MLKLRIGQKSALFSLSSNLINSYAIKAGSTWECHLSLQYNIKIWYALKKGPSSLKKKPAFRTVSFRNSDTSLHLKYKLTRIIDVKIGRNFRKKSILLASKMNRSFRFFRFFRERFRDFDFYEVIYEAKQKEKKESWKYFWYFW